MYDELYWRSSKYVEIDLKFYNHVYLWGFKGFKATSVDPAMANWGKLETEDDFVLPKTKCSSIFLLTLSYRTVNPQLEVDL